MGRVNVGGVRPEARIGQRCVPVRQNPASFCKIGGLGIGLWPTILLIEDLESHNKAEELNFGWSELWDG